MESYVCIATIGVAMHDVGLWVLCHIAFRFSRYSLSCAGVGIIGVSTLGVALLASYHLSLGGASWL